MSVHLRRAISSRSLFSTRHAVSSTGIRRILYGNSLVPFRGSVLCDRAVLHGPALDFCQVSRRDFAKGRKAKFQDSDNDEDSTKSVNDIGPMVKSTAVSQMEAAIDALSRDLMKLRTGRASAGMIDHIIVETNGAKLPLNHVAVVSVIDAKTLSVTPYDHNTLKSVQAAMVSSPLGLNPTSHGDRLLAIIPPLTKENTQALIKVVSKHAEDVKQSIRRSRQKALDLIKKAGPGLSKDDAKRLEKEVEEITKRFVKSADDICKAKEKEIGGS